VRDVGELSYCHVRFLQMHNHGCGL
jgi:hypothetical protein